MDSISERFRHWMLAKGLGFRDIAASLGVSQSLPHEWASGGGTPGRDLAILLEALTDGEIPAEAWSPNPAVHEAAHANARRRARLARRARSGKCTAETTEHKGTETGNVTAVARS
jgi:transcriptional regulator with XRE-family HTH domain